MRKIENFFSLLTKLFILVIIVFFYLIPSVFSQICDSEKSCQEKIKEYEQKLLEINQQKNTLASQINYFNTQITLTTLKIQQTENNIIRLSQEIEQLSNKIEGLNESLNFLSKTLLQKINELYKRRQVSFFDVLIDSKNASVLINRLKYIKIAQNHDQRLMFKIQQTKINFEEQKKLREEKKIELDNLKIQLADQKIELNNQKSAKQRLLIETQNNEQIYQNLLAKARAEYAAIQGIIAGVGTETQLREVKKGEIIASLIPGSSCNSSGKHLHFIVQQNGNVTNPFNYLKPIEFKNCSGSSCESGDGDLFNPSGSWDWPLDPLITLNQGFGQTWAIRNSWVGRIYQFHNGIDINGGSDLVKAVSDGVLYKGVYSVGCALSYVKLIHKENNITTFYLHVYPQ